MPKLVGSIDQGTSSTRFLLFDDVRCLLPPDSHGAQHMQHRGFTPGLATALTNPGLTEHSLLTTVWLNCGCCLCREEQSLGSTRWNSSSCTPSQDGASTVRTPRLRLKAFSEPFPAAAAGPGPWRRCLGPGVAGRTPAALTDQPSDPDVPSLVACQIQ